MPVIFTLTRTPHACVACGRRWTFLIRLTDLDTRRTVWACWRHALKVMAS